ncbi:MAG: MerR family transcriptional regulator, partial [Bacilli bacterium]|nr:MerR family transcriptional regulator [Bacilli bacterium]
IYMLIKEVEYRVGLTKKSIRYYELEGLLSPKRNLNNDYREYSEEDINTLKLIKFLRELNVPISDIKKLKNNKLSLSTCMNDRIAKITEEEKNYNLIKNMCYEISKSHDNFASIDISKYSKVMNVLNKKGFTMRDVSKNHHKKILGAILSSLAFSAIFIALAGTITYFEFTEVEAIPIPIYLIIMFILCFPVLGIVINLIKRIAEIKGGEEDEASKY